MTDVDATFPAPAAPGTSSGVAGATPTGRLVPLVAVALLQPDHPCLPAEPADDEES